MNVKKRNVLKRLFAIRLGEKEEKEIGILVDEERKWNGGRNVYVGKVIRDLISREAARIRAKNAFGGKKAG